MGRKRISDEVGAHALQQLETETPMAVRYLLQLIETKYPGHSVELRIPPFGAIQCIAGLNHRRGTPPNVVELAPQDFIRICRGELSFADAAATGKVSVSGVLASELTEIFPLDL